MADPVKNMKRMDVGSTGLRAWKCVLFWREGKEALWDKGILEERPKREEELPRQILVEVRCR
jgi:hypothetical protein